MDTLPFPDDDDSALSVAETEPTAAQAERADPPAIAEAPLAPVGESQQEIAPDAAPATPHPVEPTLGWLARLRRPNVVVAVYVCDGQAFVVKLHRRGSAICLEAAQRFPLLQMGTKLPPIASNHNVVIGLEDDAVQYQMGSYPPMSRAELATVLEREARALCPEQEICWDYCLMGKADDGVHQQVLLAAAPLDLIARCKASLPGSRSKMQWSGVGSHRLVHLAVLHRCFPQDAVCGLVDVHGDSLTLDICERSEARGAVAEHPRLAHDTFGRR